MESEKKYFVFISYSNLDNEWAVWLRHELEHYHLPASFNGRTDVRESLREVFRDRDELSAGPEWDQQVQKALENTNNLIVICSPNSAKSEAVNKEVEAFVAMGKGDCIFPFIVDGNSPDEYFPKSLEHSKVGGDVNKDGGRDAAFVKVVSGMLQVNYSDLWNRYELEKAEEERKQREQKDNLLRLHSRFIAEKANSLTESGDAYLARRVLLEILPKDLKHPDRPCPVEVEAAFRLANKHDTMILRGTKYNYLYAGFRSNGTEVITLADKHDVTRHTEIGIWDLFSGCCKQVYTKYADVDLPIEFNRDGLLWDKIISPNRQYSFVEPKFLICNTDSSKNKVLLDSDSYVNCAVFSNTSRLLATVSENKERGEQYIYTKICVWDVATGDRLYVFDKHKDTVYSVMFSYDERYLVSASDDCDIRIWDLLNGECTQVLEEQYGVSYASFSPNGKFIVAATKSGKIHIWRLSDNLFFELKGHNGVIESVFFSPDGERVVSAASDKTVRVQNVFSGTKNKTFKWHSKELSMVAYNKQMNVIAAASYDNTISIGNPENGDCLKKMTGHSREVLWVDFSPDGSQVATVSYDYTLRIWEVKSGQCIKIIDTGLSNSVSYSPDGRFIVHSSKGRHIIVRNTSNWEIVWENCMQYDTNYDINTVFFSPNGQKIILAYMGEDIRVYDLQNEANMTILEGHAEYVLSAVFSPDGTKILSASHDHTIRVWDCNTGECEMVIEAGAPVYSAYYSENGKYIVSSIGHRIIIWEAVFGVKMTEYSVSNLATAKFINEDKQIMAADRYGKVKIYEFPSFQELIDETRERFKDNPLTLEERRQYYLE